MCYVDAMYDHSKDLIRVSERVNGERKLIDHRPVYEFYVEDPSGPHVSTFGDKAIKIVCKNRAEFQKEVAMHKHLKLFESDIKPLNKALVRHYQETEQADLHTAFFDIEVNFDPELGYSSTEDAFAEINAIGVYLQWSKTMVCLTVPPPTMTYDEAKILAEGIGPEVFICKDEAEMLRLFLQVIEDADVLSGWNSEGYDIPYTVNRIIKVLGKSETRKMCLWDQLPKTRTYESFGKMQQTYDLVGRQHMDYLNLFKKFSYEEYHSYRLDYIGEMVVGENKVEYTGTLDQLYKHDYEKFIRYNIQDVMLLDKIDQKLQYIYLANTMAHSNSVTIPVTMGSVALIEQAYINEIHSLGMIVPDRKSKTKEKPAAGAYVAFPKKGYHRWIGSMDINSLYPSTIRALNMCVETIVGQVRTEYTDRELHEKMNGNWKGDVDKRLVIGKKNGHMSAPEAWTMKFCVNEYDMIMDQDEMHTLKFDLESGETLEATGKQLYELIFKSGQPWCLSANGTVFRTDTKGIVPGLLERWYVERQEMQAKKKSWGKFSDGIEIPDRLK